MKLGDLAQSIKQGIVVEASNLTNVPTNYLYLQAQNIKSGFVTEENAKYILEKTGKKYTKADMLEYGDILVYHKDGQFFDIFRFTQDFTKKIIPSPSFAIIKGANSFLTNILQLESGKSYVKSELEEIDKRQDNYWRKVVISIKDIDIPLSFEEEDIRMSPGNMSVSEADFAKINIKEAIISVDNIIRRVKRGNLKIQGYFQRTSGLWENDIKSRLIETLIIRIPIPPLYLDIVDYNTTWLVVDGLQRINAVTEFFANKFPLQGLDYLPLLNGKYYKDLDEALQIKFIESQFTTFQIQAGTPRSVRYKIFRSINTSALVLNRQEIRHAINEDEQIDGFTPSRYVRELANILNLHKPNIRDKDRMYDCELALRYIAFRLSFYKEYPGNSIADFLDKTMDIMYSYPKNKLEIYKEDLSRALILLTYIFDKEILFTYQMIDKAEENKRIRGSLVEIWTCSVAQLSNDDQKKLRDRAKIIREKTQHLKGDKTFLRSIDPSYNNAAEMVKVRFSTILNLINNTLNDN